MTQGETAAGKLGADDIADAQPGEGAGARPAWIPRSPVLSAVLLGIVAAVISAIRSPNVSLFTDEAVTISAAGRSWAQLWAMLGNIDAVHGLYYAIAKAWSDLAGIDEFRLRLPSAVFAGLAVAFTFALGRLLVSRSFGIAAAAVCLLLPRLTWAGIEARPWALAAALATAASLLLVLGIRTGRTVYFAGYALVAATGCVANIYLSLIVGAHAVTVLLAARRRDIVVRYLAAAAFAGFVTLPVLLTVRGQQDQLGQGASDVVTIARQAIVNAVFLGDTPTPEAVPAWLRLAWPVGGVLLAAVGWALIVLTCWPARSTGRKEYRLTLALALPWLVVPIVVIGVYSITLSPIFQPRYFTSVVPAAALLIAAGLRRLRSRIWRWTTVALLLLAMVPVYLSQRVDYAKAGTDWSTASAVIAERSADGESVYFMPRYPPVDGIAKVTARRISYAYPAPFAALRDVTLLRTGAETASIDGESALLEDLVPALESHPVVWLVYGKVHPPEIIEHDLAFFEARGFVEAERWEGPRTVLIKYVQQ